MYAGPQHRTAALYKARMPKSCRFLTSNPADQADSCCVPGAVHEGWMQQLAEPKWQVTHEYFNDGCIDELNQ